MSEAKPFKRVILEWAQPISKEVLFKVINEHYGKDLLRLAVDGHALRVELVELTDRDTHTNKEKEKNKP